MQTYADPMQKLAGFEVVPGSQSLRVAIHGEDDGTTSEDERMPDEERLKVEARNHGGEYPWCYEANRKPRIRGRCELFGGTEIVHHLRAFAYSLSCQ